MPLRDYAVQAIRLRHGGYASARILLLERKNSFDHIL